MQLVSRTVDLSQGREIDPALSIVEVLLKTCSTGETTSFVGRVNNGTGKLEDLHAFFVCFTLGEFPVVEG